MNDNYRPLASSEAGDERIEQLLRAFRGIEPPPRPSDQTVIEQLREIPLRRWSRTASIIERTRRMPLAIRLGMVACVVVAVVLVGVELGVGNAAFADVDAAISKQGSVRIQVEIDAQAPNMKQSVKHTIYASMKPLVVRTESADGKIEILDVAAGKRLLIEPVKKVATLHFTPKPDDKVPKSLLGALQLHFHVNAQTAVNREQLDGQEVLVYRIEQPMPTSKSRIKETMWVDSQTKLPVKVQGEIVPTDPTMSQFSSRVVLSDFQWSPPDASKAKMFSTEPPSGFELQTIDLRSLEPKQRPRPTSQSKE
jgi:hypothetical protein